MTDHFHHIARVQFLCMWLLAILFSVNWDKNLNEVKQWGVGSFYSYVIIRTGAVSFRQAIIKYVLIYQEGSDQSLIASYNIDVTHTLIQVDNKGEPVSSRFPYP